MRDVLRELIRAPYSGRELEMAAFEVLTCSDGSFDVREGVLFDPATGEAYPIMDGVPVMLDDGFTAEFLERHRSEISKNSKLAALRLKPGPHKDWSFSREWDEHFATNSERTWGYTVEERLEQFLMETQTSIPWLKRKLVLDAGCGNGALSNEITKLGAVTVGLDFSSSVRPADRHRSSKNVHFVQGDLKAPPLAEDSFDLVFSIGVLHHTPNTLKTFHSVARLVKPGGKFYVWLYRRPERFLGRYLKVPVYDFARFTISRLPPKLQDTAVNAYARLVRATHNLRDRSNPIPLREYVISAYDDLTCRWRFYHTPIEVSRWFHECGFTAPTLTHWDNPYGFGVVATKEAQESTPGIHYGSGTKLWDASKTLLGKLHSE